MLARSVILMSTGLVRDVNGVTVYPAVQGVSLVLAMMLADVPGARMAIGKRVLPLLTSVIVRYCSALLLTGIKFVRPSPTVEHRKFARRRETVYAVNAEMDITDLPQVLPVKVCIFLSFSRRDLSNILACTPLVGCMEVKCSGPGTSICVASDGLCPAGYFKNGSFCSRVS